jgi:hypothetical protein
MLKLPAARFANSGRPMLDNPEKTTKLLTAMKAALPFEVELTPDVIAYLRAQRVANNVKPMQMVAKVSYAGDDGGVICISRPKTGMTGSSSRSPTSASIVPSRSPRPCSITRSIG